MGDKKGSPAYTIAGRHKEQIDDRVKVPGPGQYNNVNPDNYKAHSPVYTISARYTLPSDSSKKPGPGEYCPEKVGFVIIIWDALDKLQCMYKDNYWKWKFWSKWFKLDGFFHACKDYNLPKRNGNLSELNKFFLPKKFCLLKHIEFILIQVNSILL